MDFLSTKELRLVIGTGDWELMVTFCSISFKCLFCAHAAHGAHAGFQSSGLVKFKHYILTKFCLRLGESLSSVS